MENNPSPGGSMKLKNTSLVLDARSDLLPDGRKQLELSCLSKGWVKRLSETMKGQIMVRVD
jgi:hypothetical protein